MTSSIPRGRLAHDLRQDLFRALNAAKRLDLDRASGLDVSSDQIIALGRTCGHVSAYRRVLVAISRNLAFTRVRLYSDDLDLDRDLARVRAFIRDLDHSQDLQSIHDRDLDLARGSAVLLERKLAAAAGEQDTRPTVRAPRKRISPVAGCAVGVVVRVLPPVDRPRYAGECKAELYELAEVSRRAQWAYAARLICCASRLRRELRHAARKVVG